ncbi:hypothetical protein GRI55_03020 [Erythrobacter citreus]|uniref:Uncharacterized protein n=1 Tax=Qipengyuania citrea TaxID=225971 RepID=A0A6I4U7Z0_9SPHN|nr:hypothetical protein [Qipengyuania citrea]MDQ0566379.1 hypothetical protein [Qipengyuania citrea]MXP34738.1 hypothetical protein [Qipengyuania citrea]
MSAANHPAPISSHPLFKWAVGAWFALLLGLGLFVMPAAVHLSLGERLALDTVLTDPALLRMALSALAALLGLLLGLAIAGRIAALTDASYGEDDPVEDAPSESEPETKIWLGDVDEPAAPVPHAPPEPAAAPAPRRLFNPREDLAEEGIAPFRDPTAIPPLAIDPVETAPQDAEFENIEPAGQDPFSTELWADPLSGDGDDDAWTVTEHDPLDHPEEPVELPPSAPEPSITAPADPEEEEEDHYPIARQATDETGFGMAGEGDWQSADPSIPPASLSELSLEELTQRLGDALAACKAGDEDAGAPADSVVAFLQRETGREAGQHHVAQGEPEQEDPQAELRRALDKLTRIGKPD